MIEKEYIEMCRKAEEIQEQWEPKEGDITIDKNGLETICPNFRGFDKGYWKKHTEWIMRQEDLQAIYIDTEKINWQKAFIKFKDWVILTVIVDRNEFNRINSLTTLWLHFIMESCYGKRYDQEKKCWVRI